MAMKETIFNVSYFFVESTNTVYCVTTWCANGTFQTSVKVRAFVDLAFDASPPQND